MLELKNVSKIYRTKTQEVKALDNVNLYFEEKGLVFITGKSGSGKTTLLNVIGGLDNFEEGELIIKDKSTYSFTKSDYDSYRNTYIGFVFQEYNMLDNLTIEKNLSLATELQGKSFDKEIIDKILETVDLSDVASRKPQELSGGQRQRVAIARALIKNPSIIMADEPTGALDTANGLQVINLLKKLSQDKLVIVVSHDLKLANKFADRIINLEDGHIESDITITIDENKKDNIVVKSNAVSIKRGAHLKERELKEIQEAVENGKDVHVTDNINIIKKKTDIQERVEYKNTAFIKTHMGFWDTIKLGLNTLRTKKVRLVFTIILCAIAFAVFGIFDSLAIYDEGRLAANTLKSSITPSVTLSAKISENNGNSYSIDIGDALLTSLTSQTGYDVKGVYNNYYVGTNTPNELNNNNPYKVSRYYYYKAFRGAVEFNEQDIKNYGFSIKAGRLPENFEEVAISEYFANCMLNWWYTYQDKAGKVKVLESMDEIINEEHPLTLTIGTTGTKTTYKIVGIINTGRINKKFDKLLENYENCTSMEQNEFLNYINNGYFLYLFTKPGFSINALQKYNTISRYINSAYAFQFEGKDTKQNEKQVVSARSNFYNFNDLKNLTTNYIFIDENKNTLEENEVLIDVTQFATLYSDYINYYLAIGGNNPNFTNVVDDVRYKINQLNESFSIAEKFENLRFAIEILDAISRAESGVTDGRSVLERTFIARKFDTSKYQPGTTNPVEVKVNENEFKIVGFYAGINVVSTSSFVMETNGISNLGVSLMQGRYSSMLATNTGHASVNKLSNLLLNSSGLTYECRNSALATVRANSDFFAKLSLMFTILSAVFALFSIAMFSNFISTSIKGKYSEIGILRALGARGADILKMFIVESLALAVINAFFASIIIGVGCIFVNMFLSNMLNLAIPLASFGIRQVLITLGLSVLVGVISATLPIWSVSKQKPVETIRKAF